MSIHALMEVHHTTGFSILVAVFFAFMIVGHPKTYGLVNKLFQRLRGIRVSINGNGPLARGGCPQMPGLLLHALVAGIVTFLILKLVPVIPAH